MISIIGSGRVGSAIAFLCAHYALDDIVLVNRNGKKAKGVALDISNAIPDESTISISGSDDFSQISGSEIVVITASVRTHLQSRAELMYDQAVMLSDISKNLVKHSPDAKILVVTNPVDVLTYLLQKDGFPSKNVIGVASNLDSSRFRYFLAKEFATDQSKITDAIVMGEHDDSMVPVFSHAKFEGKPVDVLLDEQRKLAITNNVRNYWRYFREYGVHSIFGIAKNTFDIISSISKNQSFTVPVSVLLDGQYGLSDVCIGVPAELTGAGVTKIPQVVLNDIEFNAFTNSARIVRQNIENVLAFLKKSN